jgi:hypothetical protein
MVFSGVKYIKCCLPPDAVKIEKNTPGVQAWEPRWIKPSWPINRGAEDAVAFAKPIFIDAIKEMTLTDALNIVKGSKDAATQYFKQKTTEKLIQAFHAIGKEFFGKSECHEILWRYCYLV